MKKLLAILSVLIVTALFTGCSLLPTVTPVQTRVTEMPVEKVFQYEGLDYTNGEVLVRVQSPVHLARILDNEGSQVLKEWNQIGWALVSVPEDQEVLDFIADLRKQEGVLLVTPNLRYTVDAVPEAIQYDDQWGFQNIHAESAWDLTTGDEGVIVAIIDSGVDMSHDEFADKSFIDPYNATDGTSDVTDFHGHGTHVAGIAADNGRTGRIAGVAWDSPIMPVKVMDVSGQLSSEYLIEAMMYLGTYAATHPEIRIVANMSIGGRGYDFALKDAIDYAVLEGDVLLVTSAGNEYKRVPSYPSAYNGVVSVAASTPWDIRADFSSMGPWNSVAAPGTRILSTLPDGGYAAWDGTSMASPFVAGAAALLLSKYPTLSPLEIKNQIEQTARGVGFSEELGYGILDMDDLLGPLHPMMYGSLNVATNIISTDQTGWLGVGMITVFDSTDMLVAYGTTGEDGNHLFHALKPGTYDVNVGYYNQNTENYHVTTKQITIVTSATQNLAFDFPLPVMPTRTLLATYSFGEPDVYSLYLDIEVTEEGFFEFETTFNTVLCDTVVTLMDSNYGIIAENDDYEGQYSYLGLNLQPGTYFILIETSSGNPPLYCDFHVYLTK